jgi:hypothetical protein
MGVEFGQGICGDLTQAETRDIKSNYRCDNSWPPKSLNSGGL